MKPYLGDVTLKSGYNPLVTKFNDGRTCSMVTKEQWIASMDSLENNAWQYLHIEEKTNEENEEIIEEEISTKGYKYFPMVAAIITMIILSAYLITL